MGAETLVTGSQVNTATAETKETQTQTPETKTQETKTEETKTQETKTETLITGKDKETKTDETKETKTETKAPETYADFKLPEGIEVDTEAMGGFKTLAKELNLTQEQAQKLVDLQAGSLKKQIDGQTKLLADLSDKWTAAVKKEYGDKLPEELAFVAKTRDLFAKEHPEAAKDLGEILEDSRLGNNPALFKFFAFIGRAISEDKFVTGKSAAGAKSAAEIIFGGK